MLVTYQRPDRTRVEVPQWYAEMKDPDYWLAACRARAELLSMTHGHDDAKEDHDA